MRVEAKVGMRLDVLDQRIGQLGVELFVKAALCAIGIGLLAGLTAALIGS